jgi:hypothetical protein
LAKKARHQKRPLQALPTADDGRCKSVISSSPRQQAAPEFDSDTVFLLARCLFLCKMTEKGLFKGIILVGTATSSDQCMAGAAADEDYSCDTGGFHVDKSFGLVQRRRCRSYFAQRVFRRCRQAACIWADAKMDALFFLQQSGVENDPW